MTPEKRTAESSNPHVAKKIADPENIRQAALLDFTHTNPAHASSIEFHTAT